MELIKKNLNDSKRHILEVWNEEFGLIHPISDRVFQEKILDSEVFMNDLSYALYADNEFLGFIAVKRSIFEKNRSKLYISIIFVPKKQRNKCIGKKLLIDLFKQAVTLGYNEIIIGGDEQCVFSGVFHKNNQDSHDFFINSGFKADSDNINLILNGSLDVHYSDTKIRFQLGIDESQKEKVLELIEKNFSERWHSEVAKASCDDIGVLMDDDEIIGFINTGTNASEHLPNSMNDHMLYDSLAGIGPLGISPEYRKKGLGLVLVNQALEELSKRGASDIMVDWTGLDYFYRKCGFTEQHEKYTIYKMSLEEIS